MHLIRHSLSPRTEGDSCIARVTYPFPVSGDYTNGISTKKDFGVPISPNGFCGLIIDGDFPKVVPPTLTKQI